MGCDSKEMIIMPTHLVICSKNCDPDNCHLKSWPVEISPGRESWREIAREEDNKQLNGIEFAEGVRPGRIAPRPRAARLRSNGFQHTARESVSFGGRRRE
jgi:hypothetical protein